jgi:lysophospholipase L1-like esterase
MRERNDQLTEKKPGILQSIGMNLLLLLFSLSFILILSEITLRFVPLEIFKRLQSQDRAQKQVEEVHPAGLYTLDQEIGWTLTPEFSKRFKKGDFDIEVKANAWGIRSEELGPKKPGEFRILGLGDSFAFGWGVENDQGFYKVLEAKLNRDSENKSYQVVNAGIPGFGTYEALQLTKKLSDKIQPDFVMLAFYEGNDYQNNQEAPRAREIVNGYLANAKPKISPVKKFLKEKSLIFKLASVKWDQLQKKRSFKSSVKKTYGYLNDLKTYLDSKKIPLLVVLIPDQDAAFYSRSPLLRKYDRMAGGIDYFKARSQLQEFCAANGILYLSLSKRFEDAEESSSLRLKDTHFNAKGHAAAAEEIFQYFSSLTDLKEKKPTLS